MESSRLTDLLLEQSQEFRSLHRKHKDLESRLQEFGGRRFLHTRDEVETRRLKKEKLALKDRMAAIAEEFSARGSRRDGAGPRP